MAYEFYFGIAVCLVSSVMYDLCKKVWKKRKKLAEELKEFKGVKL